jgi:hypothetical protein
MCSHRSETIRVQVLGDSCAVRLNLVVLFVFVFLVVPGVCVG